MPKAILQSGLSVGLQRVIDYNRFTVLK